MYYLTVLSGACAKHGNVTESQYIKHEIVQVYTVKVSWARKREKYFLSSEYERKGSAHEKLKEASPLYRLSRQSVNITTTIDMSRLDYLPDIMI